MVQRHVTEVDLVRERLVRTEQELLRLADYFDAVLTHVRGAIAKKQTRDEIVKLEALPGFETYAGSGTILSLAGVLGNAYDELSTTP